MSLRRKHLLRYIVLLILIFLLATFRLPYYVYKPGSADELTPIVHVDDGFSSAGEMYLVTVSGGQATPIAYALAKILPHHEILPIDDVRPKDLSDEEYMKIQLQMMESSQEASKVVAYENANKDIKIEYEGVFVVSVIEGMPAESKLLPGDKILSVNGEEVKESNDLIDYVAQQKEGDEINLNILRDDENLSVVIPLKMYEDFSKIGIGVQLVTDRKVEVHPDVTFSSGNIGGPSAGLMFSLKIYDQLVEEDFTKGYNIVGTGEIDYDGKVHRIGGIDKKVVAADRVGCDIFFAPNENGAKDSNYFEAQQMAEEIGTDMKIVPVDTFIDALTYLENLDPK